MEELDEFGIPIKKTSTPQSAKIEMDEFGIPLKKKEPSTTSFVQGVSDKLGLKPSTPFVQSTGQKLPLKTAETTTPSVSTKKAEIKLQPLNIEQIKAATTKSTADIGKPDVPKQVIPKLEVKATEGSIADLSIKKQKYTDELNLANQEYLRLEQEYAPIMEELEVLGKEYEATQDPELAKQYNNLYLQAKPALDKMKMFSENEKILSAGLRNVEQMQDANYEKNYGVGSMVKRGFGNTVANIVNSTGKIIETFGDLAAQNSFAAAYAPKALAQEDDKLTDQLARDIDEYYKRINEAVNKQVPKSFASYSPLSDKPSAAKLLDFGINAFAQLAPTVVAGLTTGGVGAAAMGFTMEFGGVYDTFHDPIKQRYIKQGLSEKEAEAKADLEAGLMSTGVAMIIGQLDKFGATEMINAASKKMLAKKITQDALIELGEKTGKEAAETAIKKSLVQNLASFGKGYGKAVLPEVITEPIQELVAPAAADVYETTTGEEIFEEGLGNKQTWINAGNSSIGALMASSPGGIVGGASSVTTQGYRKAVSMKDPAEFDRFNAILTAEVESGLTTPEQAQEAIDVIQKVQIVDKQIPSTIQNEVERTAAANLLIEKQNITDEIDGKDAALVAPQKERLKQIDTALNDIATGKFNEELTKQDEQRGIEEPISAGTDVLETGVGMAAEPGKERVAGEDIQAEAVPQTPLEKQKAEIEKRRQEELADNGLKGLNKKARNEFINYINTKYDAELAALEKPQVPEVVSEKVTEVTAPAIEVTPTAEPTKPAAKAEPTKEAAKTEAKKSKPEQIGEGLLDALGLEPVEPAKKAGKKKPVNVSNKSELSELEGKAQGDKKTIIEAAKKAIATLKSVFPDMEIYIHEDTDSYNETMSDVGGVANSRGNFAFERDANDNPTGRGRIDINLSNAKDTTVAHELVHAVLLKAFGDNPAVFKAFRDRMSKILRADLNEQVTAFEKLYAGQDVAPEEYLTELAALLSQGGETVEYKPSTLRKVAALINEFVSRITKGKFQPFKSEVDFINFVGFLNQVSGAISEGGVIEQLNTQQAYSDGRAIQVPADFKAVKYKSEKVSKSQIGDYTFPSNIEILKISNLPIKTLEEVVKQYKGRVVIITSDATGYGVDSDGEPILGGAGFASNKINVNDGIGFASLNEGTVKGTYTRAEKAYGFGKTLVLIMVQPPHTTINNSYGAKYMLRGLLKIGELNATELEKTKNAIKNFVIKSKSVQEEFKSEAKKARDAEELKQAEIEINKLKKLKENGKVLTKEQNAAIKKYDAKIKKKEAEGKVEEVTKQRATQKALFELLDKIQPGADLNSLIKEFLNITTFTLRKEIGLGILPSSKETRTDKRTTYSKIAFNNINYSIYDFLKEYGDKTILTEDMMLNNKGGVLVGGFELDVTEVEQREKLIKEIQSKGILHPLFNAKLPGKNHFRLDDLYGAQENFGKYAVPDKVIDENKIGEDELGDLVRKIFTSNSDYEPKFRSIPLNDRTYTHLKIANKTKFKDEVLAPKGFLKEKEADVATKVAKGEGFIPLPSAAEQMAEATMVSKPKDAASAISEYNEAPPAKKQNLKSKAQVAVSEETGFVPVSFWVEQLKGNVGYLDDVIKHILDARQELKEGKVTENKVAKAYLITLGSMGSGGGWYSSWKDKTKQTISDIFLEKKNGKDWIRPEGAAAAYLVTPEGKKLVKDIIAGNATQEQIKDLFSYIGFGRENSKSEYVVKTIARGDIKAMTDLFNKNKGRDFAELYQEAMKLEGIGEGKTGFFNQYFGVSERGVIDARELNAWVAGSMKLTPEQKEKVKKAASSKKLGDQLLGYIEQVGIELGYPKDLAGYIAHHAIWDAIANSVTTHAGEYSVVSKAQKAQTDKIKEFIDAQRKAGQSDKDIKAGLELVADKVGLTPEDINNLMGVESDEAKPLKGFKQKEKPAKETEGEKTGTRAFATKSVERAGVPIEDIPASLKNYIPTTVEEQQKIAEDFIRKHGIDNTITQLRLKDSGIDPKNKPVLASVLLKELYAEQGNTKDVAEIEKIAIDVHNVLDAVLTSATEAAQFMAMMREFYNSNPYNYVAQVTRLIEKNINNPIKANVATAVVDINKANKDAAAKAASNVVNEVVTSKVTSAKEKFERSKANLKALWKKSFNIGIASNQYEAAKNDVQFAKALTIMAKDFVVYQSVQFSEFLKEVATELGLKESDIDKDHLRKIFEKAKSAKIQEGIKVGLKELELKLKDLIESHYSASELEGKLIDKLKKEFGVNSEFGLNDAAIKELEEAIKREIKVLTAKEKIKALKALGIKEQKDVNEILSLSEEGLLDDNAILETLGDKLGIKKLTPEEAAKLADLAKDINESKEDRIKARNIQKFEDYKFVLAKKYKIQDFLISNYLTNIFGSLTSNEKNIAGNVSETILLVGELMGNALASGNPKDIQRALKALVDGNIRGFDFTKEVITTGVASYKEPGDIRARNMWELIMDRENDLTRVERNLQMLFKIPYLGPVLLAERRFWNRALLSMDSLSGTTNNELGSLLAATREADKQKLRGAKRTKFIEEQMANSAEAKEEARNYAISAGYKEGTGEFNRAVANYLVSKRPEAIKKAAAEYSARATLTQTPPPSTMTGAIANGLNDVISKNPNIKFFVPVVNTFANLIVKNIERSPFEFFSLAFDAGRAASGVESAKAGLTKAEVARRMKTAAVWTAISVLLFALAGGTDDDEEGFEVFGSGTGDPAVDKARRALGWKPNTVRFSKDGGYYNFEFLPFGFVLGMIGNMRDYFKYKNKPAFAIRQAQAKKIFGKNLDALDKNEREQLEAELAIPGKYNISAQEKKEFSNLLYELASTPVTYSFQLLKSLGELVNAVGEGAGAIKTAMKSITNISRGLAAPRYLGEVRDIFDNKLYDSKEFRNVIGANVPFVKLGNVKLDAFGREIEKYKSESILSGIKYALTRGFYNPPTITPLDQFLWENGVGVSVPSNTPSMAYTEDVYREYIVTRGKILITNLTEALKNKEFEGLSPQEVLEVVNIYVTNANAEARDITDEKLDKLK